jgi:hypothetical protein
LSELDPTPKKKCTKLRRSYAIADIAVYSDAAESEHETHKSNDEYEPASGHATDEDRETLSDSDNEPTPNKRQKATKVPVREVINANCKEHGLCKEKNKVSRLIFIDELEPLY